MSFSSLIKIQALSFVPLKKRKKSRTGHKTLQPPVMFPISSCSSVLPSLSSSGLITGTLLFPFPSRARRKVKKKRKEKKGDLEPQLKPDLLLTPAKGLYYYDSQPPRRRLRDPWLSALTPALLLQPQEYGVGDGLFLTQADLRLQTEAMLSCVLSYKLGSCGPAPKGL